LITEGLALFNAGNYWHAHEIWEQGWLVSQEPQTTLYQGLIQAAAGLVHWQRGNLRGLVRNWYKARPRLVAVASLTQVVDLHAFILAMDRFVRASGPVGCAPLLSQTSAAIAR
jgi:predicted metal-dependent hydrolase